jgi:Arc/MetJ-type ribon-helix-helix transcriptional regulator
MKISVSLPDEDVQFLDERAAGNRSAIIHQAIVLFRERELTTEYEMAARDWVGSEDATLWENVTDDGLS